jgi:molecular chaperone GrpE
MSDDAAGTEDPAHDDGDSVVDAVAGEAAEYDGERAGESEDPAADEPGDRPLDERIRALAAHLDDDAPDAGALADEAADLRARAERAETLESKLKRKQAEFENYKKRQEREREKLEERATEAFVERVVEVRDDLVRALDQGEDADLRDGIEGTLGTFDEVLAEEGVEPVEPEPGDEVDPVRHEVLLREPSDHPEGSVVRLYRPGYEMAGKVVQTAQVTVSEGGETAADDDGGRD